MVIQTSLMSSILFMFLNRLLEFIPSPLGYFPNDQSYKSSHLFMNVNMFFFPFVLVLGSHTRTLFWPMHVFNSRVWMAFGGGLV
jgi:hypothetical protein